MSVRVTVLIPTYDYGPFIGEAIDSVRRQTLDDLEILVVDDGSTDETPEVLAAIEDSRLRVIRTSNRGPAPARNTGLEAARGQYLAYLDADDRWRPDKLARQVALLEAEPDVDYVFTDFVRFSDGGWFPQTQFDFATELPGIASRPAAGREGTVWTGDTFLEPARLGFMPIYPSTLLIRRDRLGQLRYPPDVPKSEDLYYFLLLFRDGRGAYLEDPLVEIRRHGGNSFVDRHTKLRTDLIALQKFRREPMSPDRRKALERRIARAWCSLGYHEFHSGRVAEAARAYAAAIRLPSRRLTALAHLVGLPLALFGRAGASDEEAFDAPEGLLDAPPA